MERKDSNGAVIHHDDHPGTIQLQADKETIALTNTARKRSAELARALFEMGVEIAQARAKVAGMLRTAKARAAGGGL